MSAPRIIVEEGIEMPELRTMGGLVREGLEVSVRLDYAPGYGRAALMQLAQVVAEARRAVESAP